MSLTVVVDFYYDNPGTAEIGYDSSYTSTFPGRLYEVRVYSTAMDEKELRAVVEST